MITIGPPLELALKLLRNLVGLTLVIGGSIHAMRDANPHEAGIAGTSMRGPGAQIRARLERVSAQLEAAPAAALVEVDDILTSLHAERSALESPLEGDTREALAREAMAMRVAALQATNPLPEGSKGAFIGSLVPGAAWSDWDLGVPASITIAQAILESNWGKSAPGFNLFGLKGVGPEGSTRRKVVEYSHGRRKVRTALFRAYGSVDGAMADHASILAKSRHYTRARKVSEDYASYAAALQGTYATDPRYASKITGLVEKLGLDRFDWNARSPWQ